MLQGCQYFDLALNNDMKRILNIPVANNLIAGFETAKFGVPDEGCPFAVIPSGQEKEILLILVLGLVRVIKE